MSDSNRNKPVDDCKEKTAPRLLERLQAALSASRFSEPTIERYVSWNRRFILFHGKRHPQTMAANEVEEDIEAGRIAVQLRIAEIPPAGDQHGQSAADQAAQQ